MKRMIFCLMAMMGVLTLSAQSVYAVSYTHLTLPTICSV